MKYPFSIFIALLLAVISPSLAVAEDSPVDFDRDIRPILSANCYACHGPDAERRKARLRLDQKDALYEALRSESIPVVPGDRSASAVFERITAEDPDDRMPPEDFGKTLSQEEIETIGLWIDQGAAWSGHWAFEAITKPEIPEASDNAWPRNPIDHFMLRKMEAQGLSPSPEAERRTLIRRVYFDLTGLPPTPEEIEAFLADDSHYAYEKLVDRLLRSPRYGERWARHWLDVARYGDTHGYDKDKRRPNAWPYRDYVIRAFNDDKPWSAFVREQIAGDILKPEDPDGIIATGFLAAGPWDFVGHVELRDGTKDKKITRVLDRDDMVAGTMSAFTSMTVHCARCHDHKFDPIAQSEYYGLQAVFAGVERANRPYHTNRELHRRRVQLEAQADAAKARLALVEKRLTSFSSPDLAALDFEIDVLRSQVDKLQDGESISPSNGYHSAIASTQDDEKWVLLDFGARKEIDEVRLYPAFPTDFADTPGFGFPLRFRIEADNGIGFSSPTPIALHDQQDFENPGDAPVIFSDLDVTARFLRISVQRLWDRGEDFVFALGELEVQSRGRNIAPEARITAKDTIENGRWARKYLTDGYSSREWLADTPDPRDQDVERTKLVERMDALTSRRKSLLAGLAGVEAIDEQRTLAEDVAHIEKQIDALPAPDWVYAAAQNFKPEGNFKPFDGPRPVYVLARGDVDQPLEEAVPGALACVPGLESTFNLYPGADEGARRVALANWIVDLRNPLTWRSVVNRIWHYHFGQGIVDTPNDFGAMGSPPTHPELLDWLAASFVENDESLKWLHRLIVTSATYRQTSQSNEAAAEIDAGNRYLWRMNRRQLDAESLHDAVLAVSGQLDLKMGGPGYDAFAFEDDHSPRYIYSEHDPNDADSLRRSIYRFVVRSAPDPFMATLDCADPSQSVPVRNATNTALQALALYNNDFVIQHAAHFAEALESAFPGARDQQLKRAYALALGRPATLSELMEMGPYAETHGLAAACRVLFNLNEFTFVD